MTWNNIIPTLHTIFGYLKIGQSYLHTFFPPGDKLQLSHNLDLLSKRGKTLSNLLILVGLTDIFDSQRVRFALLALLVPVAHISGIFPPFII